ncbi:hypothetical protein MMC07_003116 [Pseudocyphellaria aurata]|nr:hypothetical protein [Pseudocyphellaria aurata]
MELPHSSEQEDPQTAEEGLRKLESEIYQPIDPKNYRPETWTRCSIEGMAQIQFSKFVTFVIARFRSQSGRLDEVPLFVKLLDTEGSIDFMTLALEQIPEFRMEPPHGPHSPCMILLCQLLQKLPRLKPKWPKSKKATTKPEELYENGLSDKEIDLISTTMFGPGSVENCPRKKRLLQSTIELGFPKAALKNAANIAKHTNTQILRDAQGLPSELWVPQKKPIELIPTRPNSQYSFLADTMPRHQFHTADMTPAMYRAVSRPSKTSSLQPGVPGPSSSRAAKADSPPSNPTVPTKSGSSSSRAARADPPPSNPTVPTNSGPSSSRAARADCPSASTHSHSAVSTSSGKQAMPRDPPQDDSEDEDDEPPAEWLEQEGLVSMADSWRPNSQRDERTPAVLELSREDLKRRTAELAWVKREQSASSRTRRSWSIN